MIALLIRSCLPDSKCLDSMRFWSVVPRAGANLNYLIDFCLLFFYSIVSFVNKIACFLSLDKIK